MIYLVTALTALTVSFLVAALATWVSQDGRVLKKQLAQLQIPKSTEARLAERRAHRVVSKRAKTIMEALGSRVAVGHARATPCETGCCMPGSAALALSTCSFRSGMILSLMLGACGIFTLVAMQASPGLWLPVIALCALVGWSLPFLLVKRRAKIRQRHMQVAVPDMLDLLVVCVEAGLGLNQAMYRVAQDIDAVSTDLAEELAITNLEIRAGTPRADALRGLADRMGLEDVRSLTSMLVQTDRFGTSIGQALRVHADTLRTKRRQRAEEAAAKTSIKMIFPLALFVFQPSSWSCLDPPSSCCATSWEGCSHGGFSR